jgi:thiamine pyrophosphate-dependent acetolactate synthase large subunit-like protein
MKMSTEESFVKVLQRHGIEHAFGIIGSAMMPVSDLFPKAGISFWDCAHETNAGLIADGYARATGKMAMAIAQNGPGVTGFVTAVKTAYWNHTPMLLVTPQAANRTMGQGGFQEVPQMALFEDMVCYQEEVRDPSRIPEVLNRVIEKAWRGSAPAQINIPCGWSGRRAAGRRSPRRRSFCRKRSSRSSSTVRAWSSAGRSRSQWRWPSGSTRRCAAATSTTTPSPAIIALRWARSATTARRRRWS